MSEVPDSVISTIRRRATVGLFDGQDTIQNRYYITRLCSHFHGLSGTIIIFSRDTGHHSSGWMKNPDYERCLHLSLSFRAPLEDWAIDRLANPQVLARLGGIFELAPFSMKRAQPWVERILSPDHNLAWRESPFTKTGKDLGVTHFRLFCDEAWKPIKPRGEVYSTDFTEKGWRSYSELNQPMPSHVNAD